MAIPPSPGKYTTEELQLKIDEAKANIQYVESKLAEMKAHPEIYLKKAEVAGIATPKGEIGKKDDKNDKDKASYGLGKK